MDLGISQLAGPVRDLRKDGKRIGFVWEQGRNRYKEQVWFKRYFIARPNDLLLENVQPAREWELLVPAFENELEPYTKQLTRFEFAMLIDYRNDLRKRGISNHGGMSAPFKHNFIPFHEWAKKEQLTLF